MVVWYSRNKKANRAKKNKNITEEFKFGIAVKLSNINFFIKQRWEENGGENNEKERMSCDISAMLHRIWLQDKVSETVIWK